MNPRHLVLLVLWTCLYHEGSSIRLYVYVYKRVSAFISVYSQRTDSPGPVLHRFVDCGIRYGNRLVKVGREDALANGDGPAF